MSDSNLQDNYKRAYDNQIGFGQSPALILIDFVQAYFEPSCDLYAEPAAAALASALRVRDAAREAGLPIIYTCVVYQADGADGGVFYRKARVLKNFVAGSPMGNWPKGLEPADGEIVISKQYPSAFFGTSLATTLHTMGVDTLIMTGLTTSGCVRASCVDAMSYGFIPIIIGEACGDRHSDPHEANLFDMNAKYGDVVSEQAVLAHLAAQ